MNKTQSMEKISELTNYQLCKITKRLIVNEHLGFRNSSSALESIHNEFLNRNKSELYNDALDDALLLLEKLNELAEGSKISRLQRLRDMPKQQLLEFLKNSMEREQRTDAKLEDNETEILNTFGLSENSFTCSVLGPSMQDASIFDGDTLIADASIKAITGHIVIVSIEGKQFVKRLKEENGTSWLMSENKDYPSVEITDDMNIDFLGVVVSVLHKVENLGARSLGV